MTKIISMAWLGVCLATVCMIAHGDTGSDSPKGAPPRKTIAEREMIGLLAIHGIEEKDATDLIWDIARLHGSLDMQGYVVCRRKESRDVVPALIALLRELDDAHAEVVLEPRSGYEKYIGTNRQPPVDGGRVFMCLACFGDSRAEKAILDFFDANAPRRIRNGGDVGDLAWWLYCLGWQKTEKAQDLLLEMLGRGFWCDEFGLDLKYAPYDEYALAEGESQADLDETALRLLRGAALTALSYSGTDRALEMLATGNGVPEDLRDALEDRSLFRSAVRRRVGIFDHPESNGEEIPAEKTAEMAELFRRYGLTYTEDPSLKNRSHISPPHPMVYER